MGSAVYAAAMPTKKDMSVDRLSSCRHAVGFSFVEIFVVMPYNLFKY